MKLSLRNHDISTFARRHMRGPHKEELEVKHDPLRLDSHLSALQPPLHFGHALTEEISSVIDEAEQLTNGEQPVQIQAAGIVTDPSPPLALTHHSA